MTYSIRQPYDPSLYVSRQQEEEVDKWWWESKKRLLSVTAPPATGKTWFLKKVEEAFRVQGIISFWVDVRDLLSDKGVIKNRNLNPEFVNKWLKELVDEINECCSNQLGEFGFSSSPTENIEKLVVAIEKLCQSNSNICVFIDDGDQFDNDGWREFEHKVLAPFAKYKSLRFVIAVRENRSVETFDLRINEKRIKLETLAPSLGKQQIKQLLEQKLANSTQSIEEFLEILQNREYQPVHPGINNFICLFAEQNPKVSSEIDILTSISIFHDALEAVNPQSKDDIKYFTVLLQSLSMFDDEWSLEDLAETFQVSNTRAGDYLQVLEDNALITRAKINRYTIVDGIREFTRAILQEQRIYTVMPSVGSQTFLPLNFHYKMDQKFDKEDLKEICFNLGIDVENTLVSMKKLNKIIDLIQYCERHDRLSDLITQCQRLRPKVDWLS